MQRDRSKTDETANLTTACNARRGLQHSRSPSLSFSVLLSADQATLQVTLQPFERLTIHQVGHGQDVLSAGRSEKLKSI